MLNSDEIIEAGFTALRGINPTRTQTELIVKAERRALRLKFVQVGIGFAGSLTVLAILAVAFKPTSALAALKESARLSGSQPVVHIHIERAGDVPNPSSPPWPTTKPNDIWKFQDHYLRVQGTELTDLHRDGRVLTYDSRYTQGFQSKYAADKDRFWSFDGTIGIELGDAHRNPPTVKKVTWHGSQFNDYEWHDTDAMQHKKTEHVYVDPDSKLVRYSFEDIESEDGSRSRTTATVDYPSSLEAKRQAPQFPSGLKFRTKNDLLKEFHDGIAHAEQTKSLDGIRTDLYGVVVYSNTPDGIGVDVITVGGAGPDYSSGHQPEVVGAPLLPVKRSQWVSQYADVTHARFGHTQSIANRSYIVNQSDDLLLRAPKSLTIRVPVWRLLKSTMDRDGKQVHPHDFVGYVTFTTSKIFTNVGGPDMSLLGTPNLEESPDN